MPIEINLWKKNITEIHKTGMKFNKCQLVVFANQMEMVSLYNILFNLFLFI